MKTHLLGRRSSWLLALFGTWLSVSPCAASEVYPAALKSALGLKVPPECTLCHASTLGGKGTVVTKFGQTLLMLGVSGNSDMNSLTHALKMEQASPVDSDGDSVADLQELRDGSDPNKVDREPPPDPDPPVSEGGSAAGGISGGPSGSAGEAGVDEPSAAGSGGTASVPVEPDPPPLVVTEFPTLETGCSTAAGRTPGGLSGVVVALAALGAWRSRRVRRGAAHR